MEVEEKDLIIHTWYKVKAAISSSSYGGKIYHFSPNKSGSASSCRWFYDIGNSFGSEGGLSRNNSTFNGEPYILCEQVEAEWCEKCYKDQKVTFPIPTEQTNPFLIF